MDSPESVFSVGISYLNSIGDTVGQYHVYKVGEFSVSSEILYAALTIDISAFYYCHVVLKHPLVNIFFNSNYSS